MPNRMPNPPSLRTPLLRTGGMTSSIIAAAATSCPRGVASKSKSFIKDKVNPIPVEANAEPHAKPSITPNPIAANRRYDITNHRCCGHQLSQRSCQQVQVLHQRQSEPNSGGSQCRTACQTLHHSEPHCCEQEV